MSMVIDLIGQINCHVIGCKTRNLVPARESTVGSGTTRLWLVLPLEF